MIFHKNKLTPYEGCELYGRVLQTFVRGELCLPRRAVPLSKSEDNSSHKRASAK